MRSLPYDSLVAKSDYPSLHADNRERKHTRFWDADGKRKWALFPYKSSSHNHIYNAKYVSQLGMISIKSWETPLSWHTECSLPVAVRVSKMRVLKLPIIQNQGTEKCHFHLLSSLSSVLVYFLILNEKCHFVFHWERLILIWSYIQFGLKLV